MGKRRQVFYECNGLGTLDCYCGGDLCVCGMDGQDCFGCEKCEDRDGDDYFEGPELDRQSGVPRHEGTK